MAPAEDAPEALPLLGSPLLDPEDELVAPLPVPGTPLAPALPPDVALSPDAGDPLVLWPSPDAPVVPLLMIVLPLEGEDGVVPLELQPEQLAPTSNAKRMRRLIGPSPTVTFAPPFRASKPLWWGATFAAPLLG